MRTSPNSHEKMLECLPHPCRVVQEVYEHLMMCLKCSWLHLTLYNIFCFKKCKLSAPNAISFNPRLIYIQKCGLTAQIKMRLTLCQPLCHPPLFLPNGQPPCQPPSVSHACQPHFIKCIKNADWQLRLKWGWPYVSLTVTLHCFPPMVSLLVSHPLSAIEVSLWSKLKLKCQTPVSHCQPLFSHLVSLPCPLFTAPRSASATFVLKFRGACPKIK